MVGFGDIVDTSLWELSPSDQDPIQTVDGVGTLPIELVQGGTVVAVLGC